MEEDNRLNKPIMTTPIPEAKPWFKKWWGVLITIFLALIVIILILASIGSRIDPTLPPVPGSIEIATEYGFDNKTVADIEKKVENESKMDVDVEVNSYSTDKSREEIV